MIPAVLRLAFRVCSGALLPFLLAACVTEVPSPPRVDVPEPGAATAARPAATARRSAARAYPAASPGARAYPAGGGARAYPAQAPAAASVGVPADDTSGITVQSSTETPADSYPAGDAAVYPAAAPVAADTGVASPAPSAIAIEEGHVPARSPNAAVNALLASADGSRRRGDLGAAVAAAERALRIQPGDPAVYCELGLLRLAQGQRELAIQLARKGLAQQPEPDLRARLEDLIARASAASG